MSVKVSALCWKVRLAATEKLILLRLADYADDQGFNIYPAVQTVADDCGVGRRAAQLTLKKLVDVGILVVINQGGGRRRTTEYAIDMDLVKQLKDAPPSEKSHFNGHAVNSAKGANSESSAPFTGVNSASDDINSAPDSPNPLESVKEEEESVCDVGVNPREAHTQAPPDSSGTRSAVVVPFRQPLPEGWVLPEAWRVWAQEAGQSGIDFAAQRFFDFHFERGNLKTPAGWDHAWQRWITENLERGYGNGQQRHDHRHRGNGDLASVVLSDLPSWFGNP